MQKTAAKNAATDLACLVMPRILTAGAGMRSAQAVIVRAWAGNQKLSPSANESPIRTAPSGVLELSLKI